MKLEDLTQDKLDELLAESEAARNTISGMKADLVKLKAKAKGAEIDPEAHAELQNKVEILQAELDKVGKLSKKQLDELNGQISAKDAALTKYLIDSQLSDGLAKAGVKPEFMDAAKALLRNGATIKAENGEYSALIGDKAITEAIGAWASSDQGKHFVAAPVNSGGGGQGGGNGGGSQKAGDFGGDKQSRLAAIAAKFPDLNKT